MRVAIIINPASGREARRPASAADRVAQARAWLSARGIGADVAVTTGPGHAAELVRSFAARGVDRFVAWGGDGTVNEVGGSLLGTPFTLGLVGAGSGDGFARGLQLPRDVNRALDVATGPAIRRLDVGWLGARHFFSVSGIGFDAAIARAFNQRRSRGLGGYLVEGLIGVLRYQPREYDFEAQGVTLSGRRLMLSFANGPQYGNGLFLDRDADPGDGWLDAVIVDEGSVIDHVWRSRRLFLASTKPARGITRMRLQSARISGELLLCHADGETFEATRTIDLRITPAAINVAVEPTGLASGAG